MKDTMREIGLERSRAVGQLGLPVQAAPIDRTATGVALGDGSGVEASWGWLKDIAQVALPLVQQALR